MTTTKEAAGLVERKLRLLGALTFAALDLAFDCFTDHFKAIFAFRQNGIDPRLGSFSQGQVQALIP